jgi:hypothetical protein
MGKPAATTSSRNTLITVLLIVGIGAGLLLLLVPPKTAPKPAGPAATTNAAPAGTAAPAPAAVDLGAVVGDWLREDGGYQLKLTRDASGGKLNAAYLNPRPIKVSYCTATNDNGSMKVRVELNDTGYPGCVYTLVHDRDNDRLLGTYYQAAMGETYEVVFVRMR